MSSSQTKTWSCYTANVTAIKSTDTLNLTTLQYNFSYKRTQWKPLFIYKQLYQHFLNKSNRLRIYIHTSKGISPTNNFKYYTRTRGVNLHIVTSRFAAVRIVRLFNKYSLVVSNSNFWHHSDPQNTPCSAVSVRGSQTNFLVALRCLNCELS